MDNLKNLEVKILDKDEKTNNTWVSTHKVVQNNGQVIFYGSEQDCENFISSISCVNLPTFS